MYLIIHVFIYTLLLFNNSLKIIKIDRNMSELWQAVSEKYNFIISTVVGFIMWIVY